MVSWSTVGFLKSQRKRFRVHWNVLRKIKLIRRRPRWVKARPGNLQEIIERQIKNPLYDKIPFLHGLERVLYCSLYYYQVVLRDEFLRHFYAQNEPRGLYDRLMQQMRIMQCLNDVVTFAHYGGNPFTSSMSFETSPEIVEQLERTKSDTVCPCNNDIFVSYLDRLDRFLTKGKVQISEQHFGNAESLRRKRQFFRDIRKVKETFLQAFFRSRSRTNCALS